MTVQQLPQERSACSRCRAAAFGPCRDSAGNPFPQTPDGPLVHPGRPQAGG